jgi:hypothetical protein
MHHAVTIRAKQHEVFKSSLASWHKCMNRFDVMGLNKPIATRTVGDPLASLLLPLSPRATA